MTLLAVGLAGCSARSVPATADPAAAARVIEETAPDRPLRVLFGWRALEAQARFSGRGVARIAAPLHARLDLFGPTGESYLSAALIGDEVRLPRGVAAPQLPPPALAWAVLGVVAPPERARLIGTRETADALELFYDADGGRLVYVLEGGQLRVVEWERGDRRMSVELEGGIDGLPRQSVYRDWSGYTELVLNLESVDEVEPYPPEIWTPGD